VTRATLFDSLTAARSGAPCELDLARWFASPALWERTREELPLVSFATFKGNACKKVNALAVHALVLDADELGDTTAPALCRRAQDALGGVETIVSTTWNSRPGALRARVVHPVSRDLSPDEYALVWPLVARAYQVRSGIKLDGACKDASRRFFVPAVAPGGLYVFERIAGAAFGVDAWLAAAKRMRDGKARPARAKVLRFPGSGDRGRYLRAAVERECEAVALAREGERNAQLNRSAYALARLELAADEIEKVLTEAAKRAGLTAGEARKTIQSAIRGRRRAG
jgi:hypothetical protein